MSLRVLNGLLLGTTIDPPGGEGAPGGGGTPPPAVWHTGQDAETVGYLQNRGWDKLDAKDAAIAAVKSYREAEKHIGAPPDQILRMPKDVNDKDGWSKLWTKIGVPTEAKDYDFTGVKNADGSDVNADVLNTIRSLAHANHLPKDAAPSIAKEVVKLLGATKESEASAYSAKLEVERGTLRTNWGANAAAFKVIAENAAQKLGVTPEEVVALEKTVGYARVMDMFRNIGQKIGEDKFVGGGGGSGNDVMTKGQAEAQLTTLGNDTEWLKKLEAGDAAAVQQFHNLTRIKSGYTG